MDRSYHLLCSSAPDIQFWLHKKAYRKEPHTPTMRKVVWFIVWTPHYFSPIIRGYTFVGIGGLEQPPELGNVSSLSSSLPPTPESKAKTTVFAHRLIIRRKRNTTRRRNSMRRDINPLERIDCGIACDGRAQALSALTGPLLPVVPLRWIALDVCVVTVDLDQCSTRQSITSFSHKKDRQSNFPKNSCLVYHLCEASEKTKPSRRQEAGGEQRDRGKIQNAKLMQQVHLQQQGPARGRRRRPRWRRGRQQRASWLSCLG